MLSAWVTLLENRRRPARSPDKKPNKQPCFLLAGNYLLLGRLAIWLDAKEHLVLSPRTTSRIFITSDIITFFMQAIGGSLASSDSHTVVKTGGNLTLAALVVQMVSVLTFSALWAVFTRRARGHRALGAHSHWRGINTALGWSLLCFIVRSIFRVIEFSQGYVFLRSAHTAERLLTID